MAEDQGAFDLGGFLTGLCERLRALWHRSFGQPNNSMAVDKLIPANSGWVLMVNCSYASQVFIINTGVDSEIQFALSDDWDVGGIIPPGDGRALADFRGAIYVKTSTQAEAGYCNVIALGLWLD
jgi:hypothetical protein